MIRILLSSKLGELRWTQKELLKRTGIRPNTVNELYHELADRVNLEHLDLICEALDCEIGDVIARVPKDIKVIHKKNIAPSQIGAATPIPKMVVFFC